MTKVRYINQTFEFGAFGYGRGSVENAEFRNCRFLGSPAPDFVGCSFHDCDLSGLKLFRLERCRLWSTDLSGCDFTEASVSFTETHRESPCRAHGAKWAGMHAVIDCRFFAGLELGPGDAWDFVAIALLMQSPDRKSIYRSVPDRFRPRLEALLRRQFRETR